ncbi:g5779 [Coccomyxa elongata]
MAANSRSPTAQTLLAWQDAHQLLQALNDKTAKGDALHAGVVWQLSGPHHVQGQRGGQESTASYRPIKLLNTEYKLAARTLATRLGPVLYHGVDATQTGFLPKRWGSPLSALLFVLATQPMAAHARRLDQMQAFQPTRLPSGDPAPIMHLHADDTTIHASSPRDAQVILDTSVDLHSAATGSKEQRGKSQGISLWSLSHLAGPDATTGVLFAAHGASVKHLGIPLFKEPADALSGVYSVSPGS